VWTNTTIKFLLFKRIPGRGEIFEEVSEKDLQPGDILLFPLQTSSVKHINVFKHAAVYCGFGEVIHFQGSGTESPDAGPPSTWDVITTRKIHGLISKTGYASLRKERGKCEIYRKKGGVNLNDLHSEIQKAMNSEAEYSLYKNNCIHFALSLLGLEEFYSELIFKFCVFKTIPEHRNIFEEVPEHKLQPGDIVLFLLESSSQELSSIFRHAAVYCGDGELIQFQRIQSSSGLTSSGVIAPALVTKEGLGTMKKKWGKFKIYHKTDGVALNDFREKVRKAMNNDAEHDFMKNNCIHFALSLLGLEEFYSELVWTNTTTRFLLFKSVRGHGQIFEVLSQSELHPGDILLFPMDGSNNTIYQMIFRHAAVYCGDDEVIHFVATGTQRKRDVISSRTTSGVIAKEGLVKMVKERGKYLIYRKKDGVNLIDFHEKVREAMNREAEYCASKNNCIHFALSLLGLEKFSSELVMGKTGSISKKKMLEGSVMSLHSSSCLDETIPEHRNIFEEVPEHKLQPGDIVLFLLESSSQELSSIFRHAAVYCGDGELIQFRRILSSSGLTRSGVIAPALVTKEGLGTMKKKWGKFKIYHKTDGVALDDFREKVREAMNNDAEHDFMKNNCIHFALSLLGLEKFSSELIFKFCVFKTIPEHRNIFEEVPEHKLQPGDIVLFLLESSSQELSSIFRHAAVYCGDGELIQFRRIQSSSGLISSGVIAPALVTKEGLGTMKKKWGKFKIYHKTDGVALDDFREKVREAMNNDAEHDFMKNNCIHFALSLLGLEKFSSELREYTSIMFLLYKSLPDRGVIFEEVSEQDLKPGDIVLFRMMSSYIMCSKVFQHAAVYCGCGEVIHFLVGSDTTSLGQISGSTYEGMIVKSGFVALKKKRGKCEIYRKKGGVNLNDLHSEIEKAMNSEAEYSLYKNNCIHFALSLLGLEEFYSELKKHICGKIFEKVSERNLQPGDIVSFPLESSSEKHSNVFKHAAVYCGSAEVIKFQDSGTQSTWDLISSKKFQGEIVKSGFHAQKNERPDCEIYRTKSGVSLNDLCSELKKAMNNEAEYSCYKNVCIHFTLTILSLQEFSSELLWTNATTRFLLFKSVRGHGQIFEVLSQSELHPGDILLFPMDGSNNTIYQMIFRHAAVYCGDDEVIHFVATGTQRKRDVISSRTTSGVIAKEGLVKMVKERGKYLIYRKKDGVNLIDFHEKVREAMNREAEYCASKNNCIHFALSLLGLEKFSSELVMGNTGSISKKKMLEGSVMSLHSSSYLDEIFKFCLFKTISEHRNIFEEVPESKLQPGDIVLFLLESSSQELSSIFRHAAVYCGDGELIQFRRIQSSSGLTSSGVTAPALVTKEGLGTMKKKWGKFKIYHKTDGVALDDFREKVREAMNNDAEHDFMKNNCIHFALSLLGLEKFSSGLVEIQDEGDSSHSETIFKFCLFKTISEHRNIFEEVPEHKLQPGDIVLFLLESSSQELSSIFRHAAVYCGDGELIQFRRIQSSSGLTSSGVIAPALVTKEGLGTMKKKWGKFKIYHKTDGVALDDFREKVREAMNNDAEHDFMKNNCIHFALSLLGLEKFSSELREYTSIMFLLYKSLPDRGVIFEEVSEQDLKPGDIVLFRMMSSYIMCSKVFQHAAVYCGCGEVIHFLVGSDTTSLGQISGSTYEGMIVKSGFIALKQERGKCEIYRKKGGVNLNDLHSEIEKAMNSEAEYSLYKNNCIHFALSLLGLEEFYSELKKHICGKIFEKVSERNLQPGDIVSFPLESSSEKHSNVFKHAAVYCGSGEVIKFQDSGTQSTWDLISSKKFQGEIVKSGFHAQKNERPDCEIYRTKSGVNLNDLCSELKKAMNSEAEYSRYKNICIHFTLTILSLQEFSSELREYTSIKFLWSKSLPGHEDIFEEVSESELQPGDIMLFPESNANFISRALFKHAAIYCGDGEVIHFQSTGRGHIGLINKQGFEALKRERGDCHIYRKKGGVDLNDLRSKVRTAMDSEAEYSLRTNNCIHFALSLLGLEEFYSELVSTELVSRPRWDGSCTHPQPCVCILT
ncbi:hypothetical protein Q9233_009540, partial [Columba guinea]